jgi:hypothetical protein
VGSKVSAADAFIFMLFAETATTTALFGGPVGDLFPSHMLPTATVYDWYFAVALRCSHHALVRWSGESLVR